MLNLLVLLLSLAVTTGQQTDIGNYNTDTPPTGYRRTTLSECSTTDWSSVAPGATYENPNSLSTRPKGCYLKGNYIYFNQHATGAPNVLSAPLYVLDTSLGDDPHAVGGHGGKFDFKGKDNTYFNIHSHTNLSVVALFSKAKYVDDALRKVFGSYMTEAHITTLTTTGAYLNISYEAGAVQPEHAKIAWVKEGKEVRTAKLTDGEATEGNVQVKVVPASEGAKVSVTQLGRWAIDLSSAQYFDESSGEKRKMHRVDVNVRPLTTAVEHEAVAPHGIIGQTFDGDNLAVSGAQDDYNKSVVVTSAQGEGAIEGSWEDYIVPSPFATEFKYGRFAAKVAPQRDITKLKGKFALRATKDANAALWA